MSVAESESSVKRQAPSTSLTPRGPVLGLSGSGGLLDLALDALRSVLRLATDVDMVVTHAEGLGGGGEVDQLGLDEVVEVLQGFGLGVSQDYSLVRGTTHVLENSLHEADGGLGVLDKLVLGLLDMETGLLLLGWGGALQAGVSDVMDSLQ